MSITSRGFYEFEPNLDRKFLQIPFMYGWCIFGKRRILACILQHNNEVSRGKFWKMFDNRAKIERITVKTRFIRHRWCRENTITSELICSLSACFCFWWIHETGNLQLQKSGAGNGVTFKITVRICLLATWRLCKMHIAGSCISSSIVRLLLTTFRAVGVPQRSCVTSAAETWTSMRSRAEYWEQYSLETDWFFQSKGHCTPRYCAG